jgi:short-subunit dehydrogenase
LPDAPTKILITGASSGLGAALARAYAAPGKTLVICGRNSERLAATAEACRRAGAAVQDLCFDMREVDSLGERLQELDSALAFDLAILNAGVGGIPAAELIVEPLQHAHDVALVNFSATVVAATAVAQGMVERGGGHIV